MPTTTFPRSRRNDTAVGLPISWYFDPCILEIEQRALFAAGPTYAGHVSLVRQEGDYVALGGQQAGQLLVHHNGRAQLVSNVCRHRQAQLLTGSGHVKNIVCPLHNWAYDLDGRHIAAPQFAEIPCLDLQRTALSEWNGLLFSGPRDIGNELAPLDAGRRLGNRGRVPSNSVLPTTLDTAGYVLERVDEEEHDLNWKEFLEVYLEDYHISVCHPGFRTMVDPADLRGALAAVGGERFFCEQVNVRWPLPAGGSPLFVEYYKVLLDVLAGRRPPFAAVWLCLFPGQLVEWYPFCMVATAYTPLTPTRTRLRSEYYFDPEIAATRRDYVECSLAVLDEVTGEDQVASERLHAGRQALYDCGDDIQGPYQLPMEQGLKCFHDCLRQVVAGDSCRE